jgi:tRNA(Ile)-lysidine synthase
MTSNAEKAFRVVRRYIEKHSMLEGARGLLIAVSGGPDSMTLLDMLVRVRDLARSNAQRAFEIQVAHFDHQLRGRQSTEDAEFVRASSVKLGLECTVGTADVRAEAKSSKRGIEETARSLRYEFLAATAEKLGLDRIAIGHNMNDQAETMLMRLIRGSGSRGLASMCPVSDIPRRRGREQPATGRQIRLIRPLLAVTREEVEEYCSTRGLEFRLDATNESNDYLRNRVRREIIPSLKGLNRGAVQSIARAAAILAGEHHLLEVQARSSLAAARSLVGSERSPQTEARYLVKTFLAQPEPIRRQMIIEAVARLRDGSGGQLTAQQVSALEQLLEENKSGKRVEIARGFTAWREFDQLVLLRRPKTVPGRADEEGSVGRVLDRSRADQAGVELNRLNTAVDFGGLRLTVERGRDAALVSAAMAEANRSRENGRNWMIAILDEEGLPENLRVRPRRAGERVTVKGRTGTKRLKSLMIDHRIPPSRRASWPVVTTPDDRYIWSPGLPLAEEFAVRDRSRSIAILRASIL